MSSPLPDVYLSPTCFLRGIETSLRTTDKAGYAFLGVPYAEPPVGELRFKKTVPQTLWEGRRDASKHGAAPIQDVESYNKVATDTGLKPIATTSEDCLFLSIYTPTLKKDAGLLPVMVFFHGGGTIMGGVDSYTGTSLAEQGAVVVPINYRLGVLGFFSTGDETCTGNFGLYDQMEGLRWVQKHISKFGGDPDNVTIFGQSAGATLTHYHHLMEVSHPLFHKSMIISGVVDMLDMYTQDTCTGMIKQLIPAFDALKDDSTPEDVYNHFRSISTEELMKGLKTVPQVFFLPFVDGQLFREDANKLFAKGSFKQCNSVYFVMTHEACMFYKGYKAMDLAKKTREDYKAFCNTHFTMNQFVFAVKDVEGLSQAAMEEYVPQAEPTEVEIEEAMMELMGDMTFFRAIHTAVRTHAGRVPEGTYYGVLGYRRSDIEVEPFVGADHGDDLMLGFGLPFLSAEDRLNRDYSDSDKQMSKLFQGYYINFAKTGNPNGKGLPHWPAYGTSGSHLYMDLNNFRQEDHAYKANRGKFWEEIVPKYR